MAELLNGILAQGIQHLNVILVVGIAVFGGTIGAHLFQKLRIPQVVGYIIIGLIIGESFLNLIGRDTVENLHSFSLFALGIIAFMIGGELRLDVFKKYGKQFFFILCSEGIAAFLLVGLGTYLVAWHFTNNLQTSIALGLVLGSIASATAPAATVTVLWEYKTRGPLTTTILAIVALDDGLALLLYGFASSIAAVLTGQGQTTMWSAVLIPVYEILGSIVLGVLTGILLSFVVKLIKEYDKALTFTIASVLLVIGLSVALRLNSILAAMALGVTIANFPRIGKKRSTFELVEKFAPPIYVLFFVLAGAHLRLAEITGWMLAMVLAYLICRTAGKLLGSWFGAKMSGATDVVRKYLGLCLLSQAGVAIGLAIISSQIFPGQIGHTIIMVVMTTTFVVEIAGPIFVKHGVKRAGEIGLNITEEDLMRTYNVADVMDKQLPIISGAASLAEITRIFGNTDSFYYPVVDDKKNLIGAITIDGIRNTLATSEANDWLVAFDIMGPVITKTTPEVPLGQAFEKIRKLDIEYLSVVAASDDDTFLGVLNYRAVRRRLSAEILERQRKADSMSSSQGS